MISQEQQQKDLLKQQRDRYSKLLRLSQQYIRYNGSYDKWYENFSQTIKLFRQIHELSKTPQGRTKLYNIQSSIIEYWIIQPLNVTWTRQGYWQVDNLCLRIIANLAMDTRFAKNVIAIKSTLVDLQRTVNSKNFSQLAKIAIKMIQLAKLKMKQDKPMNAYKQNFKNIEQVKEQFKKHDDFFNFAGHGSFFEEDYEEYIKMLSGALKVGARYQVTRMFPKGCFGCVLFSMIMTGYQLNKKQVAVRFLKQYTDGWFTDVLYDLILSGMKRLYRSLKRNENLTDRYELVCLRFHQCEQTSFIFQYFSKVGSKLNEGKIKQVPKVFFSEQFYQIGRKINYKQKMQRESSNISSNFRSQSRKSKQPFDISKLLNKQQKQYLNSLINKKLAQFQFNIKQIILKYSHSKQLNKYKFQRFVDYMYHMVIIIKFKNNKILAGYFITPSDYQKTIGSGIFINLNQTMSSLDIGEIQANAKLIRVEERKKMGKKQKHMEQMQSLQQDEDQIQNQRYRHFMMKKYRKMEQEDQFNQLNPSSQQDEEQKYKKNKKVNYQLNFNIQDQLFKLMLCIKKNENDNQNQNINKKCNNFIKNCSGSLPKQQNMPNKFDVQGLQVFQLKCNKVKNDK